MLRETVRDIGRRAAGWVRRNERGLARAIAGFFGGFVLANTLAATGGEIWLLDARVLPAAVASPALGLGSLLLAAFALRPRMRRWRKVATASLASLLALVAVLDCVSFYAAWRSGSISPGVPVPFAALTAVAMWAVARAVAAPDPVAVAPREARTALLATLAIAVLFPVAQIAFFGLTDYRAPADVVVVPGARAYASGVLSSTLADRVSTAVRLQRAGLADRILMSGGVGREGVDEAAAMRDAAIAQGVSPRDIDVDSEGVDTDATARNTASFLEDGDRVLVVSQPYHLPRLKLAYASAGLAVRTVPAEARQWIGQTPLSVLREIAGFWGYWARDCATRLGDKLAYGDGPP